MDASVQPKRLPWLAAARRSLATAQTVFDCQRRVARESAAGVWSPLERAEWLQRASHRIAKQIAIDLSVRGAVPGGPKILVANHLSYLDPIAIAHALPVCAIAKSEVRGWPSLGKTFESLGIIFVRRADPLSGAVALRKSMRLLREGVPVLVFPEGTTTLGEDVLPFRRGIFGAAKLSGVPVVPITLRYGSPEACWVGNAAFLPHFVALHRHPRVEARVEFGTPIDPSASPDAGSLAELARANVRSMLVP